MAATTCPFCGIVTDVPHETQQSCIEALHAEIDQVRGILEHTRSDTLPGEPEEDISLT